MGFFGKAFMGTVAVTLITAFVVYFASLGALERQVERETGSRVARESQLMAQTVERAWDLNAANCEEAVLRAASATLGESRVTLIAIDGHVLFDSQQSAAEMDNHLQREEVQRTGQLITRFSKTLNTEMMYYAEPVIVAGEQVAWTRVALSIQARDAQLQGLNAAVRNGVLLASLIALALAALITRQVTRPLREIEEFVAEVGRGGATRRIQTNQAGEIGRLAETVNTMADELQDQIARIQRDKAEREAILSGIDDGLIALDTQNKLLFINGSARELMQAPEGRVKSLPIEDLGASDKLLALLGESAETSDSVRGEDFIPGPEGERQVELSAVPLPGEDGKRRGSVLVLRDVTELRHLEAVRRDFVSNVSHELKTPLTAMRGYVDAVLEDSEMPQKLQTNFLVKAQQNTERLTAIVSDLLSLSRLESEERELSFETLEVLEVAEEAVRDSRDLAESRQVSLETDFANRDLLAHADAQALHMAISNLVSNAIHYSPQETGAVRVSLGSTPDEVFIDVCDNGPGIPLSEQERVFERFYRVDKARSRKLGGTGLGLSIVRHVMNAHQGRVELESAPGEGSRFRLVLPRHHE